MQSNEFLSATQAAAFSGLSVSYLNKLRSAGRGSPFLKVGRRCLYRKDQFENWLASHQKQPTKNEPSTK
ncbi:MAG: helix-turn-helix domain-containing protein [Lentilitoribacter sp.]